MSSSNFVRVLTVVLAAFATAARADTLTLGAGSQFTWNGIDGPLSTTGVVPNNLALTSNGAGNFATDDGAGYGYPWSPHVQACLNDGQYGNDSSWIGFTSRDINLGGSYGTVNKGFAGIRLVTSTRAGDVIGSFAFSRDNYTQPYTDRVVGTYYVQVTTDAFPTNATADSAWTTLGSITFASDGSAEAMRHLFTLDSAMWATGLRIVVPTVPGWSGGTAIDEIEIYSVPEPGTLVLLGSALVGLLAYAWRKRR